MQNPWEEIWEQHLQLNYQLNKITLDKLKATLFS